MFVQLISTSWGHASSALINLSLVVLLAREVAPPQLGLYFLYVGFTALLESTLTAPINQTLNNACQKLDDETGTSISFSYGISAAQRYFFISAPAALLLSIMSYVGGQELAFLVLVIVFWLPSEAIKQAALSSLYRTKRAQSISLWYFLDAVCLLVFLGGGLLFELNTFVWLVWLFTIARVAGLSIILSMVGVKYLNPSNVGVRLDPNNEAQAISFAKGIAIMGPIGWVASHADRYALAFFLSPSFTSVFVTLSGLVARPLNIVTLGITAMLRAPLIEEVQSNNSSRGLPRVFKTWCWLAVFAGTCTAGLTVMLALWFVDRAFDDIYSKEAIYVLPLVAGSLVILVCNHAIENLFLARGLSGAMARIFMVLLPINVSVMLLMTANLGLIGAAAARVVNELIRTALLVAALARK